MHFTAITVFRFTTTLSCNVTTYGIHIIGKSKLLVLLGIDVPGNVMSALSVGEKNILFFPFSPFSLAFILNLLTYQRF